MNWLAENWKLLSFWAAVAALVGTWAWPKDDKGCLLGLVAAMDFYDNPHNTITATRKLVLIILIFLVWALALLMRRKFK